MVVVVVGFVYAVVVAARQAIQYSASTPPAPPHPTHTLQIHKKAVKQSCAAAVTKVCCRCVLTDACVFTLSPRRVNETRHYKTALPSACLSVCPDLLPIFLPRFYRYGWVINAAGCGDNLDCVKFDYVRLDPVNLGFLSRDGWVRLGSVNVIQK